MSDSQIAASNCNPMTPTSVSPNKSSDNFESFELASDFGMKKSTSASDKFRTKVGEAAKCPACTKIVYKMEELYGLGLSWHKSCFTCGGTGDDGCKRKLSQQEYHNRNGAPFCNACFNRLAKEDIANTPGAFRTSKLSLPSSNHTNTDDTSTVHTDDDHVPKVNMAERASAFKFAEMTLSERVIDQAASAKSSAIAAKFRVANSTANKCPTCTKTVYKAEELFALNQFWHPGCFTCGGIEGHGCNRRLTQQNFQNYEGAPFCTACFDKQVKTGMSKGKVDTYTPSNPNEF